MDLRPALHGVRGQPVEADFTSQVSLRTVVGIVAMENAARPTDPVLVTGAAPSSGSVPVSKPTSRGRILIADDEPMLLRGLSRALTRAGFEVVTANDGNEAARLLAQMEFDAIVSDISMPGMNGIQLLRAARERDLDVPVLLVTGAPAVSGCFSATSWQPWASSACRPSGYRW